MANPIHNYSSWFIGGGNNNDDYDPGQSTPEVMTLLSESQQLAGTVNATVQQRSSNDSSYSDYSGPNLVKLDSALQQEESSTHLPVEMDLDNVVNVTREYPFDYATIMFGYIMPFVLIITIITNTMVVMVLAQRHMRTPTNIVLFTMAIVDLFTLLSPSPWYFYFYTLGHYDKFLYPPLACYAHHYMTDVIPVFFHTSSIWLALLLASQRYIYVCHPTLARTWCTVPRVRKAIKIILCVAFLHQVLRFFDNSFTGVLVQVGDEHFEACRIEIAEWVSRIDVALYYTTYFTFRILFVFVIPCFALILLNFLLFRALKRAEAKRTELLKTKFKLVGGKYRHHQENYSTAHNSQSNHHNHINHYEVNQFENTTIAREDSSFISATGRHGIESSSADLVKRQPDQQHSKKLFTIKSLGSMHKPNESAKDQAIERKGACRLMSTVSENDGYVMASVSGGVESRSSLAKQRHGSMNQKKSQLQQQQQQQEQRQQYQGSFRGHRFSSRQGLDNPDNDDEDDIDIDCDDEESSKNIDGTQDDIVSICPECASFERDDVASGDLCQRCSALIIDTDKTNRARESRTILSRTEELQQNHHYQTISQCSSLMGVATHTTTNDDISSCMATQNVSSSLLKQDATLDGDDGEANMTSAAQDENSSLSSGGSNRQQQTISQDKRRPLKLDSHRQQIPSGGANGDDIENNLIKSTSVDSRLECGCLASSSLSYAMQKEQCMHRLPRCAHRTQHNCAICRRFSSINSHNGYSRNYSQESCEDHHRRSHSGSSNSGVGSANDANDGSQASSNSCLNCNVMPNSTEKNNRIVKNRFRSSLGAERLQAAVHKDNCRKKASSVDSLERKGQDSAVAGVAQGSNPCGPDQIRCQTDDLRKSQELELSNRIASVNHITTIAATTTNTNTTTTTTTLYSANTNSVNSLLQASAQRDDMDSNIAQQQQKLQSHHSAESNRFEPANTANVSAAARLKSPSFASSTGQGSRATLLGATGVCSSAVYSTALPLVVSSASMAPASSTPASIRTMDSNRTTLMLIVVVTVFLMVEVPVALVTILHVVLNLFDVFKDIQISTSLDYIKLFTNFFIAISYSVNFSIYCSMSKKFRETFRDLFMCGRRKRKLTRKLFQYRSHNDPESQTHHNHHQTQHHLHGRQQERTKRKHQAAPSNAESRFDEQGSKYDFESRDVASNFRQKLVSRQTNHDSPHCLKKSCIREGQQKSSTSLRVRQDEIVNADLGLDYNNDNKVTECIKRADTDDFSYPTKLRECKL